MAPPRTRQSLTTALDTKILTLVRRFIDTAIDSGDTTLFHNGSLRLSVSSISQFISQSGDPSLTRTKRAHMEKAIERAIVVINKEEESADDNCEIQDDVIDLDSDFEGVDERELMDVKDTNAVNKTIVESWARNNSGNSMRAQTPGRSLRAETPGRSTRAGTPGTIAPKSIPPVPSVDPSTAAASAATSTMTTTAKKRKEKSSTSTREGGGSSKRQKPGELSREPPSNLTLADLGGVEDIISDILELIALPLTHPEVYAHTGVPPPRGVLLHGPPGCGKTMIANAIAGEIGLPFISVSAPSIVSGMSGESEKKLRDLFDEAKEKAPCIMFLDEIDAITPKRESAQREMERRIVAQMLTCMDDLTLDKTGGKPVMIIGATNRPDSLDPALRRAGRFDREICLGVPDEIGREKILRVLSKKLRLSGEFDFRKLAKMTPGFVGADLSALTAAAGVCAIKRIFHTIKIDALASVAVAASTTPTEALPSLPEGSPSAGDANGVSLTPALDDTSSAMDLDPIDPPPTILTTTTTHTPEIILPTNPTPSTLHHFLTTFTAPLTPAQLAPLTITLPDFLTALPKIQPSSKREGFTTIPNTTWTDIGALHSVRVELQMSIVQPIRHPELYASVGITAPTGVLLWGPPGCGKTLLAKAIANESRANFISIRGPELLNKYVGESERAVRQVFVRARASVPCVIFFDELDALVPRRDDGLSDASARVVNTLLTELDGLNDRKGVFVIGATNRPDVIDPAMLRPGRLDKPLLIDLPTPEERAEILVTITKKTPLDADVDLRSIALDSRAQNFSGADLASLVREAAVSALRKAVYSEIREGKEPGAGEEEKAVSGIGRIVVGREDFERAFANVRPSVSADHREQYRELATRFGK